jgi:hypothetical protein
MRTGPRVLIAFVVLFAAVCSDAFAADSLTVYVDNDQVALGASTLIAAHVETDASFGGGHVAFKFKPADADCQATPAADEGSDATSPESPAPSFPAGANAADVGGQVIQLGVGNSRVCGWLVDDASGVVVAQGSAVVQVVPFMGSLSISVRRIVRSFEVTLVYSTSAPGRLYGWVQRARRQCPRTPVRVPRDAVMLVARRGRFVGSDGGLGRELPAKRLAPGRWRVCSWLIADEGRVGPASRTFAVPRPARRGGRHVAG